MAVVGRVRGWSLWEMPAAAVCWVLAVVGGWAGACWWAVGSGPGPSGLDWLLMAVCAAGPVLSHWMEIRFGSAAHERLSLTFHPVDMWLVVLMLAASSPAVLLAGEWTLLLAWWAVHRAGRRWPGRVTAAGREPVPHRMVFNGASMTLALLAGHAVFVAVAGPGGVDDGWAAVAALVAVAVFWSANNAMVTVVIRLASGAGWRELLVANFGDGRPVAALQSLGVVVAMAWQVSPVAVVWVLPALALLQQGMMHTTLLERSRTDAKTGLANAEFWRQVSEAHVRRAVEGGPAVSVLVLDLDFFKKVNDTYGHLAGDDVLREVARRIRAAVRPGDLVGRFGGEEFVVLLPAARSGDALSIGERIRRAVAAEPVQAAGGALVAVTCSVGVAGCRPGQGVALSDLLGAADRAVYAAKAGGRNQVRSGSVSGPGGSAAVGAALVPVQPRAGRLS